MIFSKLKYISYGICISLVTTTLVSNAAGLNGIFGDYFANMTLACSSNNVVTGFDASGPNFGLRHCSTLQSILGSIFGASTAPTGQAMVGFDASGNPKYGSVNWNNSGSDISYTGGNIGISTTNPISTLTVSGSIASYSNDKYNVHQSSVFANSIYHPVFMGMRARGTYSSPSYPQNGDPLSSFLGRDAIDGLNSSTNYGGADIYMFATENFTPTNKGTKIVFDTTNNGTMLPTEKMVINHNGNVGIGTSAPVTKLDVNGDIRAGNTSYTYLGLRDDESANGLKYIHANSDVIGFLGGWGSWLAYWDAGGNQHNTGVVYASQTRTSGDTQSTRYYDDDANYYVDSNVTSRMNVVNANQLCFNGDCRSNWASVGGGGTSINMYQCPGPVSLGGGAWGYYGCQNQIQNQPTCYEVEYPTTQVFSCYYVGKISLAP